MVSKNLWLIAAGWMSVFASVLHLACIVVGPKLYLFIGAPAEIARAAERGAMFPAIVAIGIATILAVWAVFAFSGAGVISRLPLLKTGLVLISSVLLLRAMAYFIRDTWRPDLSEAFMFWTSIIVFVLGICFAVGTWKAWPTLIKQRLAV